MGQMNRFNTPFKLAMAAVLLLGNPAWAASEAQFQAAYQTFSEARVGNTGAIEPSAAAFATLHAAEPINPVLMAYAGASTAMRANATWLPWRKMGHAEDGLALLDKALAMLTAVHNAPLQHEVPAALEVRFIAANTFLAVPVFMNRGARGAKLLADVAGSPLLANAPLGFRGDVWLVAAQQAMRDKRSDDARNFLNHIVKAGAPQADAARAQLKGLAS